MGGQSYADRNTKQWDSFQEWQYFWIQRSDENKWWLIWIASDRIWHFITNLRVSEIKSIIAFLLMKRQTWMCWPAPSPARAHGRLQNVPLAYLGLKKLRS